MHLILGSWYNVTILVQEMLGGLSFMYIMIGFLLIISVLCALGTIRSKKAGNTFAFLFGAVATLSFGGSFIIAVSLRIING